MEKDIEKTANDFETLALKEEINTLLRALSKQTNQLPKEDLLLMKKYLMKLVDY